MEKILDRFLRYVSVDTQSCEESESQPSAAKELDLLGMLRDELLAMGVKAELDEFGYVMATIPSNIDKDAPKLGFIAHVDTAPDASGKDVKPQIIPDYDGGDIALKGVPGLFLKPAEFPELLGHKGETLVTTDGTTLLGADDKAGVAEIMNAVQYIVEHPEFKHGELKIGFTPDEEIGRGVEQIEMDRIFAAGGYTVDGADADELSYENFNAASADVCIHGVAVHPGEAKSIMKNASLLAMEFAGKLPAQEIPAETSGREGFYHLTEMSGNVSEAELHYILRDHDSKLLEKKKSIMRRAAADLNLKYGKGTAKIQIKNSYRNMAEKILPDNAWLLTCAREAIRAEGMIPDESPIRGGTDGATLSFMGLPCPNLGAGGMYFHGVHEVLCVESLEKCVKVLEGIAERMSREG